jgi:hypothetical protein
MLLLCSAMHGRLAGVAEHGFLGYWSGVVVSFAVGDTCWPFIGRHGHDGHESVVMTP